MLALSLLLALQVAGTHLHLCLDGQAPPVQVHRVDLPGGHEHGHEGSNAALEHADQDVLVAGNAVVRDRFFLLDLPSLLPAGWHGVVTPRQQYRAAPPPAAAPLIRQTRQRLPLPRGPPLVAYT